MASNRIAFTDQRIKALPAPTEGRTTYHDHGPSAEPGLCLRITPTGAKAFYVVGRFNGKVTFSRLGAFPDMGTAEARKAALQRRKELREGVNPIQTRREQAEAPTLGKLWDEYRKRHLEPNRKDVKQADAFWKKDLYQHRHRKLATFKPRDVVELLDSIVDRGSPQAAVKVRSLLNAAFRLGVARGLCEFNPVASTLPPAKKTARDRVLTEDEVRAFWTGLDQAAMTHPVRQALRAVLATMQRPGEVAGMRWDELDLKAGTWTLPTERTKARRAHVVPLGSLAREIIESMPKGGEYVFPGRHQGQPVDAKTLPKVLRRERLAGHFPGCKPFTPHDLRRTGATLVRSPRITVDMVAALLNHAPEGVTERHYSHYDPEQEKRRTVTAWDKRLREILEPPASNVVKLRRAAK